MGKIASEPQKETTTTHFSHPHPLKLINHQPTLNSAASCPGCNLKPSGMIYSCTTCHFFLRKKCFEMPKKITHPFHKEHAFTLLTEPAYAEGLFNCDACGETGNGFSYHCKPCGIDLHILCAAMPLSLTHACHAHVLALTFGSPYGDKAFVCDICKGPGSDHWLYRCSLCGFDAHLNCARRVPPVQPPVQNPNFMAFQSQGPMPQQAATCSRSAPWPNQPQVVRPQFAAATPQPNFMPNPMMNNAAVGVPAGGLAMPPSGINRNSNEFVIQAIQQMINNNHAMAQAMLAGGAGGIGGGLTGNGGSFGGGFGGNSGPQQLMQLISGLNHSGIGGGGIPGLNAFGGGGGGQDFLQSLMNGGVGGGGTDFLQSMLGGGNGLGFLGGGGINLLGGALGGFGF
ncbi:hypothetical protein Sango_0173800 [Sesamum angolense]|uniref:DC1 domain-containing protein n=1 Tax=Sesamum angolense TaxID=2727404 RepID=A0AAE1XFU9_9LAMI|nr:hypothetical protein Sango_0173800 [Sesamum angolense]